MANTGLGISVTVKGKLEKFDGDKVEGDGKKPVEVIEVEDSIPLSEYVKLTGEQ